MSIDLKSAAGALLYRHLPEEYRYRDNRSATEMGDLEAYLDGFGHVFDLLRDTLDQAYADGFAEVADNGRAPQSWVLPYLADLLGTQLISPDLDGTGAIRRAELEHSVGWSKGKGTLRVADSTSDVLAGAETHTVEGWRRVAVTPRLSLPPFSLPKRAGAALADLERTDAPAPLGCPDLRRISRPVIDPESTEPLQSFCLVSEDPATGLQVKEDLFWRHTNRSGAPCFPGSFGDISATTPDTRSHAATGLGPAPRRVAVFVQPQPGYFEPGLIRVVFAQQVFEDFLNNNATGTRAPVRIGPAEMLAMSGESVPASGLPNRLTVDGAITIPAGQDVAFDNLNLMGAITVKSGAQLSLEGCAARRVIPERPETAGPYRAEPGLIARHTLMDRLTHPAGFARLEYVTVLGDTQLARLQASDCIFMGPFDDPTCLDAESCVRFSRLPMGTANAGCAFAQSRSNTFVEPRFVRLVLPVPCPPGSPPNTTCCAVRVPVFGEPGAGVLDHAAPRVIREGSEDGMELGAFHSLGLAARLTALERKLAGQLPLGQTVDLRHDAMMSIRPPAYETDGGT